MDLTTLERLPLWIGGKPVAAQTTRYGEVTNPATGEVIRHVPLGNAADVDAAVAAAAAALPFWRAYPPLRRARILMRFRELMDAHRKDLAKIITQEHGKTLADAEGEVTRGIEVIEFATGIPHLLKGEFSENVGTDVDSYSLRQPVGVCAGITPFNFPGDGAAVDVPGRDRLRQHVRAEAVRARSDAVDPHGRAAAGGRPARRRVQRRARRQGGRRRAARAPGGQGDLVRGLDADREVHLRDGRAQRQARAGAGRREEPRGRAARRGPRLRDRGDHRRGLRLRGRALHGDLGGRRRRRGRRRAGREARGARAPRPRRARRRPERRDGPGHHRARRATGSSAYIDGGVAEGARLVVDGRKPGVPGHDERLLRRPDAVRRRHAGDGDLPRRDLRPGAVRRAQRVADRRDRAHQRQSVRATAPRSSRAPDTRRGGSSRTSRSA